MKRERDKESKIKMLNGMEKRKKEEEIECEGKRKWEGNII